MQGLGKASTALRPMLAQGSVTAPLPGCCQDVAPWPRDGSRGPELRPPELRPWGSPGTAPAQGTAGLGGGRASPAVCLYPAAPAESPLPPVCSQALG